MHYINITENGVGRLSFAETPAEVAGLCTKGLTTCTAIVIVGSLGMSVIHDEGHTKIDEILAEFKSSHIGTLVEWGIFCNPSYNHDRRISEMEAVTTVYTDYFCDYIKIEGDKSDVYIPRTASRITDFKLSVDEVQLDPINLNTRTAIRNLNNCAAYETKGENGGTSRVVPLDVQFDTINQVKKLPSFIYKHLKIIILCMNFANGLREEFPLDYQDFIFNLFVASEETKIMLKSSYKGAYEEVVSITDAAEKTDSLLHKINELKKSNKPAGVDLYLKLINNSTKAMRYFIKFYEKHNVINVLSGLEDAIKQVYPRFEKNTRAQKKLIAIAQKYRLNIEFSKLNDLPEKAATTIILSQTKAKNEETKTPDGSS